MDVNTVIVTPCPTKECVGFMADSGLFVMVRIHGIGTFLIKTEFLVRGELVRILSLVSGKEVQVCSIYRERLRSRITIV